MKKVSIIIICEDWNGYLKEALLKYKNLDYDNFEVLVFTTKDILRKGETLMQHSKKFRFIHDLETKNKPAEKRDLVLKYGKGGIFAFIDDDAYPSKNWLKEAVSHFRKKDVSAVGGPGVTPNNASFLEKASGWVSASPLGGFGTTHRFIPQKRKEVDDYPSMNLLVRAEDFKKVGGFDSNFYPGEDTKLCLDLTKKLGKKIIYDPKALVYHHRRSLFKKHLIQNGRYGFHRGHFAKILPENSRKWFYFIPSLFVLGLGGLVILQILNMKNYIGLYVLLLYIALLLINSLWVFVRSKDILVSILTIPGVFLTHIWYGIQFIRGFFSKSTQDFYGRTD